MTAPATTDTVKTIMTHYIDGAFVPSHGREVMDMIGPTDRRVIACVAMADEEDTRRAVTAAQRAFATYGRSTVGERAELLHRLHAATSARIDDLTAAMVDEYGGVAPLLPDDRGVERQCVQGGRSRASRDAVDA
jgi:aldehyde dehydrogenase (NAD+)